MYMLQRTDPTDARPPNCADAEIYVSNPPSLCRLHQRQRSLQSPQQLHLQRVLQPHRQFRQHVIVFLCKWTWCFSLNLTARDCFYLRVTLFSKLHGIQWQMTQTVTECHWAVFNIQIVDMYMYMYMYVHDKVHLWFAALRISTKQLQTRGSAEVCRVHPQLVRTWSDYRERWHRSHSEGGTICSWDRSHRQGRTMCSWDRSHRQGRTIAWYWTPTAWQLIGRSPARTTPGSKFDAQS